VALRIEIDDNIRPRRVGGGRDDADDVESAIRIVVGFEGSIWPREFGVWADGLAGRLESTSPAHCRRARVGWDLEHGRRLEPGAAAAGHGVAARRHRILSYSCARGEADHEGQVDEAMQWIPMDIEPSRRSEIPSPPRPPHDRRDLRRRRAIRDRHREAERPPTPASQDSRAQSPALFATGLALSSTTRRPRWAPSRSLGTWRRTDQD
jgi:hypothetical protein